jgi:hypothetical protein
MQIHMANRKYVLVAIFTVMSFGCASSYTPREPGRISIVQATGRPVLVKDGRTFGMSGLSGDLEEAVAGNSAAEDHARTFARRSRTALVLYSLGVACLVGAIATHTNEPGHPVRNDVAAGSLIGSLVFLTGFLAVFSTAPGHLYDAINIYNDSVPRGADR